MQCIVDRGILQYIDFRFREMGIVDQENYKIVGFSVLVMLN